MIDAVSSDDNGFDGAVFYNAKTNKLIIASAGTDLDERADIVEIGKLTTLGKTSQADDAQKLMDNALVALKKRGIESPNLVFTGHSLGGATSQILALKHKKAEAVVFQSPGIGGLLRDIAPMLGVHFPMQNRPSNITYVDPEFDGYAYPVHKLGERIPNSTIVTVKGLEGHSLDELSSKIRSPNAKLTFSKVIRRKHWTDNILLPPLLRPTISIFNAIREASEKYQTYGEESEIHLSGATDKASNSAPHEMVNEGKTHINYWRNPLKRYLSAPGDPEDEALLKDDLTESEVRQVMKSKAYNDNRDPRFEAVNKRVAGWFEDRFDDGPMPTDATGRTVRPGGPKRPAPKSPLPASVARTGKPLDREINRIVDKLSDTSPTPPVPSRADSAADGGGTRRVARLQEALNRDDVRHGGSFPSEPLKIDGIAGPKTRRALRGAVARLGSDGLMSRIFGPRSNHD